MPIRTVLLLLALVSTMGMPYTVLMPALAIKMLHGGAHTLGLLMGTSAWARWWARSISPPARRSWGSAASSRCR